jgi:beta-carotene 15,15'-dioxygenase
LGFEQLITHHQKQHQMVRMILLAAGFVLLICQQFIQPVSVQTQMILFLTGIVLLGVPHGAADLLVATQNAAGQQKTFSKFYFFLNYLGRLILFAALLWFFPLGGNLLFIFFAAYHFGETDLHAFKTNTLAGKLFVVSYGLLILGVILLNHFEEIKPLFMEFDAGLQHASFINWLDEYRYTILSFLGVFFFASTFFYFSTQSSSLQQHGDFIVQFALILFILYNLPMVLGFTFYFIVWHSLLSLRNIVSYLRKDGAFGSGLIVKQISIYSLAAMVGICLFGLTGAMFVNGSAMMVYVFLGLAVLTAPHMQIMHDMYKRIRSHNKTVLNTNG